MVDSSDSRELIRFTVEDDEAGKRLDNLIASRLSGFSRTRITKLIRDGDILVQNAIRKPSYRVSAGESICGRLYSDSSPEFIPEPVEFEIIYADASCIIINKPPGLVVHPSPGHPHGTLAHGLVHRFPELARIGPEPTRPGIVHRLDKDTSGLLLIARTGDAHRYFTNLFKARAISKAYTAFVYGTPETEEGRITLPLSRHHVHRKKMAATTPDQGRYAETCWRVIEHFDGITLLEFDIKTGRTHQIRVHSAAIGHQIVGDPTYGYKNPVKFFAVKPEIAQLVKPIRRQMLHARNLSFPHPETGAVVTFEAPIPEDMAAFHKALSELSNK